MSESNIWLIAISVVAVIAIVARLWVYLTMGSCFDDLKNGPPKPYKWHQEDENSYE